MQRKIISILIASALSGCTTGGDYNRSYEDGHIDNVNYYMQGDTVYVNGQLPQYQSITVPDSYYAGNRAPVSHKDQDRQWLSSQNPQGYTIEIADGEKRAQVARRLYQAPKNDRTAQFPYQHAGKTYYKGVYGSYSTKEEAEKAFQQLPAELKNGAGIQSWGSLQQQSQE